MSSAKLSLRFQVYLLLGFLLSTSEALFAQNSEFFRTEANNAGTEFYLAFPANWEINTPNKYIRLYFTSDVETSVDIYVLGQFKGSVQTIPSGVVTFDITNLEGQLFVRGDASPVPDDKIYQGQAVHIVADDPIIVQAMNRTDFTSDGFLALPVNALGKEYIVASAASVAGGVQILPSQYMVIAPYDNTTVTIVNPDDTPNHFADVPFTIVLNKGDVFSAMAPKFSSDLSGARITADKPVAVVAGQSCTYLPSFEFPACDHLVEMMLPVEAWGTEYYSMPFAMRTRGDTYRIFAAEAETEVYVNGTLLATLNSMGSNSVADWTELRQEKREPLSFIGNKPIFVVQYNNSQSYDNSVSTDPFYTILTPRRQFQTDVVFSVSTVDFANNFVNLVGDSAGLAQLQITEAGKNDWENVIGGVATNVQFFPAESGGDRFLGVTFAIAPGTYQLRSPKPFAGSVYGGGKYDSYGYPMAVSTNGVTGLSVQREDLSDLLLSITETPVVDGQIRVEYSFPGPTAGVLTLTDMTGREYYQSVLDGHGVGRQTLWLNVPEAPPGIYFCTLAAEGVKVTRKVMLLR